MYRSRTSRWYISSIQIIKALIQYTTRDNFPPFGLVDEINKIFLDLKHKCSLLLKHNKESALKDLISIYMSMVGKAAPIYSAFEGFFK